MQLLGKNYFEKEKEKTGQDLQKENDYTEDGLEALCEAVGQEGKGHIPAWMAAAGNMVRENSRHLVIAASVLVIGFAIYLNWAMYTGGDDRTVDEAGLISSGSGTVDGIAADDGSALNGDSAVGEDVLAEDDYFAVSQINRQRARDEEIAVLQDVVDGAENLSEVQNEALAEIAQIAADIEHEATIESLVKGKGFEACVAVISGESANIIVKSSALLPNEIAQIQEIVYETSGIVPANVKIIEK